MTLMVKMATLMGTMMIMDGDNGDNYEVEFYPYDTDNGILTSRIFDW